MNYQAHRVGGACASVMVATTMYHATIHEPNTLISVGLAFVGGVIGGLLPDIDHPTSKVGRKVPLISKTINALFGHRGFTHTLVAGLLFTYFLFLCSTILPDMIQAFFLPFGLGLAVGYFSHLLLDMLTVSGIPLFYPIFRKDIRIAKLHSGRDDFMVMVFTVVITGAYLYIYSKL